METTEIQIHLNTKQTVAHTQLIAPNLTRQLQWGSEYRTSEIQIHLNTKRQLLGIKIVGPFEGR